MKPLRHVLSACLALVAAASAHAGDHPDWTQSHKPFHIYGDTYYVGTQGLSAILIGSSQGLVLIDGTLPQNAAQVEANIKALGFQLHDVKLILNTHAHFDHAGAIAAIARDSGARVAASEAGAKEMMLGGHDPEDPQFGEASEYPRVAHVDTIPDGGVARVGNVEVTAHYTPGHTPGSTTWTWQSCEAGRCLHMAYADSLSALTADGSDYRYSDPAYPERVENYRHGIAVIAALPCDILMTPHPGASDLLERVARRDAAGKPDPLIDAGACRAYAAEGTRMLDAKLAKERAGQKAAP
ncbi:subclass B3 metallo-beta-lactamase [Dyella japonica]|uniref:Beta-lactamase n=1 Tax=Dyella japonica A8 TaxID=1217721 RepID=A0A075K523_9GAMM|nr:subclass B3 metallo-beta-lactamase [Dyella japonica]AIF49264.1 beta-lactamase [Dyella japonica A8]